MTLRLMSRDLWTVLAVYADEDRCGVRVLCFFDEGRVVVCSEAMPKPKQRGLALATERAARTRWRYLNDKRRGALRIVEDQ